MGQGLTGGGEVKGSGAGWDLDGSFVGSIGWASPTGEEPRATRASQVGSSIGERSRAPSPAEERIDTGGWDLDRGFAGSKEPHDLAGGGSDAMCQGDEKNRERRWRPMRRNTEGDGSELWERCRSRLNTKRYW